MSNTPSFEEEPTLVNRTCYLLGDTERFSKKHFLTWSDAFNYLAIELAELTPEGEEGVESEIVDVGIDEDTGEDYLTWRWIDENGNVGQVILCGKNDRMEITVDSTGRDFWAFTGCGPTEPQDFRSK